MNMKMNAIKDWFYKSSTWNSWNRVLYRGGGEFGSTLEITVNGGPREDGIYLREHNTHIPSNHCKHVYPERIEQEFEEKYGKEITHGVFHADLYNMIDLPKFYEICHSDEYRGGGVELGRIMKKPVPCFIIGVVAHLNKFEHICHTLDANMGQANQFVSSAKNLGNELPMIFNYYGGCFLDVDGKQFMFTLHREPDAEQVVVEFRRGVLGAMSDMITMTINTTDVKDPKYRHGHVIDAGLQFLQDHFEGASPMRFKLITAVNTAVDCARLSIGGIELFAKLNTEIERKWRVVHHIPVQGLGVRSVEIEQFYLDDLRYRRTYDGDVFRYYKTIKHGEGLLRREYEREIPIFEYQAAQAKLGAWVPLKKRRYFLGHCGKTIELDFFETGERFAEIEFATELEAKEFNTIPAWFMEEETNNKYWSNHAMFHRHQIGRAQPVVGKIHVEGIERVFGTKES